MRQLYNEIIPNMVNKSIESHVIPTLIEATTITVTFDIWMSWEGFDMFVLVVNYISKKWVDCQITIGIFEVHKTSRTTMGLPLKDLFTHFDLCDRVICLHQRWRHQFEHFHKCLNKHYVMCYINVATTIC
jgi:hypothetical protein